MVNNKNSKKFEVLPGFPHTEEEVVSFGGQPFYSEGLIIRFFKDDGTSWIANISGGASKELKEVRQLAGDKVLALVGYGNCFFAYVFNPNDMEYEDELGYGFNKLFESDGRLILTDLTQITVFEQDGRLWSSARISWDGFKDVKVEGSVVSGYSYHYTEEWNKFTFNLDTRKITGGSYPLPYMKESEEISSNLKKLEELIMHHLCPDDHSVLREISHQWSDSEISQIKYWERGFILHYKVPEHIKPLSTVKNVSLDDVQYRLTGLGQPCGMALTIKDGFIQTLEGHTYGHDKWPDQEELLEISYTDNEPRDNKRLAERLGTNKTKLS